MKRIRMRFQNDMTSQYFQSWYARILEHLHRYIMLIDEYINTYKIEYARYKVCHAYILLKLVYYSIFHRP